MDPRRLVELLRIAEHGSYTRAAAAQGISQPALSNSIAILEKSLGVRVLERTRHGATLTEFGRLLTTYAEALQSLLSRAADDVRLKKLGMEGSLVVGVSPVACVELVPNAIARLKRETPNILVLIHERPDDQLLAGVRTGEIDAMVSPAGPFSDPPELERETLLRDVAIVIVQPRHELACRTSVSLKELRDAQWVLPSAHTAMWRHIEALFAAESVPWPVNYVSTNSITALKSLVMCTDSVSISSRKLMKHEFEAGDLACVPLRRPHFTREITLRTRRDIALSPLTQRFIAAVRAVAAEMRQAGEPESPQAGGATSRARRSRKPVRARRDRTSS
jgi:LysR family transcriptional regulator of gallate degradation